MTTEYLAEAAGMLDDPSGEKCNGMFRSLKVLPNGDSFEGLRDLISGDILYGTYKNNKTNEIYTGPFFKGLKNGNGAICFRSDGSKFIGRYRNNQPEKGTWISKEFTYTGTLHVEEEEELSRLNPGRFHGYGKLFLLGGAIYEGEFSQGQYHGVGKEILPDGSRYTGEFENGERHGLGTYINSDGQCQSGFWVHDQMIADHNIRVSRTQSISQQSQNKQSNHSKKKGETELNKEEGDDFFWEEKKHDIQTLDSDDVSDSSKDPSDDPKTGSLNTPEYSYKGQLMNNLFHGIGTLNLADGSIYEGEFSKGLYHGTGKLTDSLCSVYTGDFHDGKRHGVGTFVEQNGRCYSGDWSFDQSNGEGIETLPNGELYTGQFHQHCRHGKGTFTYNGIIMEGEWDKGEPVPTYQWTINFPDGKSYTGEMMDMLPHGFGSMKYPDYSLYTGNWNHGKRHGNGKLMSSNSEIRFQGTWDNDEFTTSNDIAVEAPSNCLTLETSDGNDQPLHRYDNGDTFVGFIDENGLRQGHGKYTDFHSKSVYEGKFKDSERNDSEGVLTTENSQYTGNFVNNDIKGKGTLHCLDGSLSTTYKGLFQNGLYHGKGTLTSSLFSADDTISDCSIYDGDFEQGMKHGIGKETLSDGTVFRGEFKDNKRNGSGSLQRKQCGNVVYSGLWKDGLMHGQGVLFMEYNNENENNNSIFEQKFEGYFAQGQKSGIGALTFSDGTVIDGKWDQDSPVDSGSWMITYGSGDIYSGCVSFNNTQHPLLPLPNGFGTMHYMNGDFYTGCFKQGKREGKGLCLCENGDSLDGSWLNDEFVT